MRLFATWCSMLAFAGALELRLPTENHHLFGNEPERFYMYVDRIFEGEVSKPWQGGAYGYVRTAIRVGDEVVLTKFHEGIDIAPIKRDKAGNPLDLVSSIADGMVVHTSAVAGRSNYGKYVVVAHDWDGSKIFSLYAHLAEITCQPGDGVRCGAVLGRMGYTGAGINRTRAHLHLELGMLLSQRYEHWHKTRVGSANHHGIYNGMNLAGADVARFFQSHRENPNLTFAHFVSETPVYFKVAVAAKPGVTPDFLARHPWMRKPGPEQPASWIVSFSSTGLPLAFEPASAVATSPVVVAVRPSKIPQRYMTRSLLTGEGNRVSLTSGGKNLVALLMDDFPSAASLETKR